MEITGRMKDFYDIYYLATTFDFIGRDLQEAIQITLTNRNRDFKNDSVAVIHRLVKNSAIQRRWDNFCKKILKYDLDFYCVVNLIIDFTLQPYESIMKDEEFLKTWKCKEKQYI